MLVGAVLGLAVGAGVLLAAPPLSQATAVLEVTPVSPELNLSGGQVGTISIDTDAQLLLSDAVVQAVAEAAGQEVGRARRSLSLTAPNLTRVLRITYKDTSEQAAQAGAQAAAEALLEARDRFILQPVRAALEGLDRPIEVLDPTQPVSASGVVAASTERQQALVAAQLAVVGPGEVLVAAAATKPERQNPEVLLGSGLATGGLVGLAVGIWRQRSRSERGPDALGSPRTTATAAPWSLRTAISCVLLFGLIGLATGAALATRLEMRPVGQANIVLRPLLGNPFEQRRGDNSVDLSTEAQLATSDEVLGPVSEAGGLTLPALRTRVRAAARPGSEVLTVTVGAATRRRAERLATAAAESLLTVRESRARAEVLRQSGLLTEFVQETQVAFDRSTAEGGDVEMSAVLGERLVVLQDLLRSLPREARAGTVADTSVRGPGIEGLIRRALPWAGLLTGLTVGLLALRWTRSGRSRSRRDPATVWT